LPRLAYYTHIISVISSNLMMFRLRLAFLALMVY